MRPLQEVFEKLSHVVSVTSQTLGRDIRFVTAGGDIVTSEAVYYQLGDSLVHLVRNSIDHGIESSIVRTRLGKPRYGTITIRARIDDESLIVEFEDDGKGISPEAIRAKAIQERIIRADSSMTDDEVSGLIFLPSFSTKTEVTNISGRGIGLDVVKTNVSQLQGKIEVQSVRGKATRFRIVIPHRPSRWEAA